MAIWSSENSVITNKGLEVLAKVQLGIGKIVVDSVVTGAGQVSIADLRLQTAVTNEKQVMTITDKRSLESGSVIDVQVTNKDLEEAYELYQIGVYVTHEDYPEKVLYMITQATKPDDMLLPSVTPVTLNYSLFLEHENTDNVVIEVSPSGSVTIGQLNEHIDDKMLHYYVSKMSGTGEAINVTNPYVTDLLDGQPLYVKLTEDLASEATIALNDGDPKNIYMSNGKPVSSGSFKAGCIVPMSYNLDEDKWYITGGGGSDIDPSKLNDFLLRDNNQSEVTEVMPVDSDTLGGQPPEYYVGGFTELSDTLIERKPNTLYGMILYNYGGGN